MKIEYSEDYPGLPKATNFIKSRLDIENLPDAIEVLHSNVNDTDCVVVAEDGWIYESLFDKFIPEDNKSWNNKK